MNSRAAVRIFGDVLKTTRQPHSVIFVGLTVTLTRSRSDLRVE
jgi:hypothetical protein